MRDAWIKACTQFRRLDRRQKTDFLLYCAAAALGISLAGGLIVTGAAFLHDAGALSLSLYSGIKARRLLRGKQSNHTLG